MKPFWRQIWRFYDSDWGRVIPRRFAPYLLGKALGSKGTYRGKWDGTGVA